MNTYNHHRIINQFTSRVNKKYPGILKAEHIKILKDASDFTDDFLDAEWEYFLYHFYYDIKIDNDTIELNRIDENTNASSASMGRSDTLLMNTWLCEKEFFSTINERPKSSKWHLFDASNQSDNVAFLHAMGSANEDKETSLKNFKDHLIKCFSEFLFIKDHDKALFMLGIAFHSIMDSFTPSHTGFKRFTEQDMAKHAQGDVIPFMGDIVYFDPGQYTEDVKADSKVAAAAHFKGYDSDNIINDTEKEMLNIFINSYLDTSDNDIRAILSSNSYLPKGTSTLLTASVLGNLPYNMLGIDRKKINDILQTKRYNNNAFDYSEKCINVLVELFIELHLIRQNCLSNYNSYKTKKKEIANLLEKKWENEYNAIQNHPASNENLYKK